MKKPIILLVLKCTALVCLLAFTSIDNFKKGNSATQVITKGNCSISIFGEDDFSNYTFCFLHNGTVIAKKDGAEVIGLWLEDKRAKKINIQFNTYNATLSKLNNLWTIKNVYKNHLQIQSPQANNTSLVTIASL